MTQRRSRLRTLGVLTLGIVLAGGLLAGLLMPWGGGPARAAQQSTSLLGDLPEELTDQLPAGNTTMVAANGELITSFYKENRAPVAGDQIAEVMKTGGGRRRGRPLLRAPWPRRPGHPARAGGQRGRRRCAGGRLDAHTGAGHADAAAGPRRPRR